MIERGDAAADDSPMMSVMILVNRNYARLWIGLAVSGVGDQIFNTTIFLWIATVLLEGERLAPVAVGGVVMAVAAATILVGPIAGVFVDRWDKRRTMLASDLIRACLVGLLAAFAFLPRDAVGTGAAR